MKKTHAAVVFLLALVIRLAWAVTSGEWREPLRHQPTEEVVLARNIAGGHGFSSPFVLLESEDRARPSAHSPPGFPYLLAALIRAGTGVSVDAAWPYRTALVINAGIGSLAVALIAVAAAGLGSVRAGWAAGALASVWPTLVGGSVRLWDTPLVMLGVACACLLAVSPPRRRLEWLSAGLLCGLLTLANPLPLPILVLSLFGLPRGESLQWKGPAIALVCLGAVVLPWEIKLYNDFGRIIPVRNNFRLELWTGNSDQADGTTAEAEKRHPVNVTAERIRMDTLGEDAYVALRGREAAQWIRASPQRFVSLTARRVGLYWFGDLRRPSIYMGFKAPMAFGINLAKLCLNAAVILLAASGLVVLWSRRYAAVVCFFAVVTIPLPYYVTHVSPNYRASLDAVVCLLAGVAASRWGACVGRTGERRSEPRTLTPAL